MVCCAQYGDMQAGQAIAQRQRSVSVSLHDELHARTGPCTSSGARNATHLLSPRCWRRQSSALEPCSACEPPGAGCVRSMRSWSGARPW